MGAWGEAHVRRNKRSELATSSKKIVLLYVIKMILDNNILCVFNTSTPTRNYSHQLKSSSFLDPGFAMARDDQYWTHMVA